MIRVIKRILLLSFIAVIGFGVWLYHYAKTPLSLMPAAQEITIKPNSGLKSIANQLVAQKVIPDALPFLILVPL